MKPHRSSKHLAFVRSLPCCVPDCRRKSDAAHLGGHGMSIKAPDDRTAPLCRHHHHELGGPGGRRAFEAKYKIHLLGIAARIALKPLISIQDGYFVGMIEGQEFRLKAVSHGVRSSLRLMIEFRREMLTEAFLGRGNRRFEREDHGFEREVA